MFLPCNHNTYNFGNCYKNYNSVILDILFLRKQSSLIFLHLAISASVVIRFTDNDNISRLGNRSMIEISSKSFPHKFSDLIL